MVGRKREPTSAGEPSSAKRDKPGTSSSVPSENFRRSDRPQRRAKTTAINTIASYNQTNRNTRGRKVAERTPGSPDVTMRSKSATNRRQPSDSPERASDTESASFVHVDKSQNGIPRDREPPKKLRKAEERSSSTGTKDKELSGDPSTSLISHRSSNAGNENDEEIDAWLKIMLETNKEPYLGRFSRFPLPSPNDLTLLGTACEFQKALEFAAMRIKCLPDDRKGQDPTPNPKYWEAGIPMWDLSTTYDESSQNTPPEPAASTMLLDKLRLQTDETYNSAGILESIIDQQKYEELGDGMKGILKMNDIEDIESVVVANRSYSKNHIRIIARAIYASLYPRNLRDNNVEFKCLVYLLTLRNVDFQQDSRQKQKTLEECLQLVTDLDGKFVRGCHTGPYIDLATQARHLSRMKVHSVLDEWDTCLRGQKILAGLNKRSMTSMDIFSKELRTNVIPEAVIALRGLFSFHIARNFPKNVLYFGKILPQPPCKPSISSRWI